MKNKSVFDEAMMFVVLAIVCLMILITLSIGRFNNTYRTTGYDNKETETELAQTSPVWDS